MAEVYKGYHAALDRYVAIKLLHPFLADDPEFKDRFEKEARNVAKLRHPNIVQVFDFEYDQHGESYYMVMELINGPTLKDKLFELAANDQRYSLEDSVRIISDTTNALSYAHKRNMIHRDVKPANLMLDEDGRIVLTDFGIAKIVTGVQFTASGGMVGTPAYMSPEQIQGDKPVDGRSDIYALGVLVYQMMTGKQPYRSDTPAKAMMMHILEPVPNILEDQPNLPAECDALIKKAMAKNPDKRFATAGEMAAELEKIAFANASTITPAKEPTLVGASTLANSRAETVVSKLASAASETVVSSRSPAPKTHLQLKAILLPAIGIL